MRRIALTCLSVSFIFCANVRASSILYENALPRIFLNQAAGALRSNIAFTESDPLNEFDGTSVIFSSTRLGGATKLEITSITTWSVASILGDPLGAEFTNVSLYFRPQGGTWQITTDANGKPETGTPHTFFDAGNPNVNSYDNPDIKSTQVPYNRRVSAYQSDNPATPDVFFPLWQNTFSNMFLEVLTGVPYEFAVWGTNPSPDPTTLYGYWFNHYSNPFLSGAREDNLSGTYLRCDATNLSAPCFVEDPRIDQTWNKGANLNIQINGIPTPEPSSLLTTGGAMIGVALFLRRRQRALAARARAERAS